MCFRDYYQWKAKGQQRGCGMSILQFEIGIIVVIQMGIVFYLLQSLKAIRSLALTIIATNSTKLLVDEIITHQSLQENNNGK